VINLQNMERSPNLRAPDDATWCNFLH
jgi:hypothetical protein